MICCAGTCKYSRLILLQFETVRRLYNDTTVQYHRDAIGKICKVLGIRIGDLLILVEDEKENE
ncbi:helix-turn-helix domain-containing protein [Domibacillus aminovorans]|uniref:helix-turn-helix domain-containing protein n=1 Tax=Domibacillus aminovorans TaxID=29332 RepID=UPI003CC7E27F